MDKKKIKNLYNSKINLLKKYNQSYFDKNNSLVSDEEYDDLKKEIINLENNYKFLNSKHSPSRIVGFKPSKNFKKSFHKTPMLSLGNAYSEDDLINFEKKSPTIYQSKIILKFFIVPSLKLMEYLLH